MYEHPLKHRFSSARHADGFTLVELMTVIAIIGILASVVVVGTSGMRARGRDTQRIAHIAQLRLALESYKRACGQYPNAGASDALPTASTNNGLYGASGTSCSGTTQWSTFMPTNPTPIGTNSYTYTTNNTAYRLRVTLENANPPLDDVDTAPTWDTTFDCSDPIYCVAP